MKKSLLAAILLSGLIVGSLDILLAFASAYFKNNASTPDKVLRYIASGVFGKKAFAPANAGSMVWVGLAFHYLIAIVFTAFFYLIYPRIKWLSANRVVTGIVYGIFVWAIMFFLVLPQTSTPGKKLQFDASTPVSILILIVAIGLPLSFFAAKYYSRRT